MNSRDSRRDNPAAIVRSLTAMALAGTAGLTVYAQKEDVPGVRNFTKVDGAACGGSTEPSGVAELAKRGYTTIISLRETGEAGAVPNDMNAAAGAAGVRFVNVPMSMSKPSDAQIDAALAAIRDGGQVFVYDASGSRAAAVWLVKRMLTDGWPEDRAVSEAIQIGLSSPALKAAVLDYVTRHK